MQYYKNFYQIKSNETIFQAIKEERKRVGYYALPFQDTTPIKKITQQIKQKHIAVVGIGGSSLGTFAIYDFLKRSNQYKRFLHFFDTTDPIDINSKIKKLDLEDTLFIVISKSGTTIETISIFKYLQTQTKIDHTNLVIISDKESKLTQYAQKNRIPSFSIPKSVGGRFSVFSAVGLLPLACVGVDIDELLNGCKEVSSSFFEQREFYKPLMEKARFIVENKYRFNINVVFSYSSSLNGFNKWYVQLWGESLGKLNVNQIRQGFTPIGLIGPVDQHSFLQLIMEGKRDKTVTFIKIKSRDDNSKIPTLELDSLEEFCYLDELSFNQLITHQADATIEAIANIKDVPYDVISIEKVDEYNLAKLMFGYQILTSVVGKFVQIDTYNQPGVEMGKIILKEKLCKRNFKYLC
jgi:glucose-6-phosphate isomerase